MNGTWFVVISLTQMKGAREEKGERERKGRSLWQKERGETYFWISVTFFFSLSSVAPLLFLGGLICCCVPIFPGFLWHLLLLLLLLFVKALFSLSLCNLITERRVRDFPRPFVSALSMCVKELWCILPLSFVCVCVDNPTNTHMVTRYRTY